MPAAATADYLGDTEPRIGDPQAQGGAAQPGAGAGEDGGRTTHDDSSRAGPRERPVGLGGARRDHSNPINALACPAISLCVAVDDHGRVLTSSDPSGGPRSWQSTDIDGGTSLTGISCPTVSLCVATDSDGNVASTTDPSGPAAAWTVAHVDSSITEPSPFGGGPGLLRGVSCPSVSFCVAVDSVGNIVYSGDPAGGAAAWAITHVDDNSDYGCVGGGVTCQAPLMGVSCPTLYLCTAVDYTGNILQSTTPSVPSPWPSQGVGGAGPQSLWSVSCPTPSFCTTVNGIGGDAISWLPVDSPPIMHRLPIEAYGIWCASTALCLAEGEAPNGTAELVGSADPAAKSPAWKVTDFGLVNAVSCPTPAICLAADNEGELLAGVTVTSLTATLRGEAIGHIPRIGFIARRRGYAFPVTSPLAGQLQVTWVAAGATARALGGHQPPARDAGNRVCALQPLRYANGPPEAHRPRPARPAKRVSVSATAIYETKTGAVSTHRKLTLSSRG